MKFRISIMAALAAVALVLTGCSGSPAGTASAKPIKIGFSVPAVDDYYGVVRDSFVAAAKAQGLDYVEGNGDNGADPTQQITNIENMLAQGITVLVVATSLPAAVPVLDRAVSLGIKVIFIDQAVPNWNKQATFIATNNPAASKAMGEYLAGKLKSGDEVGIMIGVPGIPLLLDRYENFQKVLEAKGIKVVLTSEADGCQLDSAINVARNFIVANPHLAAIYSTCGPTGLAVNQVLAEQGNHALSVSFDVQVQEINDIISGKADAAVAQFPAKLAKNAIAYALKVAAGKKVPAYVDNGTEIVTAANAQEFFHEGTTGYSYKK